jgi:hypothetical protein
VTFQVVAKSTNTTNLVIGEITAREAALAGEDNPIVDGHGIYLISVEEQNATGIGNVLAKFVSEDAAYELAKFFRLSGRLEIA